MMTERFYVAVTAPRDELNRQTMSMKRLASVKRSARHAER